MFPDKSGVDRRALCEAEHHAHIRGIGPPPGRCSPDNKGPPPPLEQPPEERGWTPLVVEGRGEQEFGGSEIGPRHSSVFLLFEGDQAWRQELR